MNYLIDVEMMKNVEPEMEDAKTAGKGKAKAKGMWCNLNVGVD